MKKIIFLFLLTTYCLLSIVSFAQVPPQVAASGTWMEMRGSNSHTGVQQMKGNMNVTPALKWQFTGAMNNLIGDGEPILADVDNDGDNDVIVGTSFSSIGDGLYVLDGTTGTMMWKFVCDCSNYTAAAGDINNNGSIEVVVGIGNQIIAFAGATGAIVWTYNTVTTIQGGGPTIADIDGNGDMEIIIGDDDKLYCIDGTTGTLQWNYGTNLQIFSAPAIADIDNNGQLDVVIGERSQSPNKRVIALNGNTGTLKWVYTIPNAGAAHSSPAVADIDNNGDIEVVIGAQNGIVYAIDGTTGTLQWTYNTGSTNMVSSPAIADIDGNGTMEIAIGTMSPPTLHVINGANGTALWTAPVIGYGCSWHSGSPKIGDFVPSSPCLEIIVSTSYTNGGSTVSMFSSTGNLIWTYNNPSVTSEGIAAGDIDGDGCIELVVQHDISGSGTRAIYALDDIGGANSCGFISGLTCTNVFSAAISHTNPLCNGQCTGTATVNPSSGTSPYTYNWSNSQTTQTITGLCAGAYSVIVTDAASSTATANVTITQPVALTATATATNSACGSNNGSATVTAGGGTPVYTYSWLPGGQTTSSITGLSAGNYTTTITDANGCIITNTVTVVSSGSIIATATSSTICGGGIATLTASGGGNYSWNTGSTTSSITVSPITTTNYSVIVSSGTCADTANATVTVVNNITAIISGSTSVCTGGNTTLTALGGGSYTWSTGATIASITVTSPGTYSVIVSSGNCSDTASATVVVSPPPVANISGSDTICLGENIMLTASGGGNYSWNTGATTSSITVAPISSTNYSVIVSMGSCADTTSAVVTVIPSPTANAASNVTISQGQSTTLTASGGGNYSWSNGATTATITVAPAITTVYCVWVTDADGCKDSSCVTVTIEPYDCSSAGKLYLPNAFSPNDDSENDELQIYYGNINCIKELHLVIYNRWGEKVFETTNPIAEWDGAYRGKTESTAVFVWYMKAELITGEKIIKKGNISLIR